MLKLNESQFIGEFNQEWYDNLDKIHDDILGWVEDENTETYGTKIVESDRQVGASRMFLSIIFNYATNNRNKKIFVVSTKGTISKEMCDLAKDLFEYNGVSPTNKTPTRITIFNGTTIDFITQDRHLGGLCDLCIFDCAMRISYINFFKIVPFTKKTIINFTSGMIPDELVSQWGKEFVERNKIEIPFTIKGLTKAQEMIKWISNSRISWKEREYALGYKELYNIFKEYI